MDQTSSYLIVHAADLDDAVSRLDCIARTEYLENELLQSSDNLD